MLYLDFSVPRTRPGLSATDKLELILGLGDTRQSQREDFGLWCRRTQNVAKHKIQGLILRLLERKYLTQVNHRLLQSVKKE